MPKPVLLLDVDGVLNPFPDRPAGYTEHHFFPGDTEPVLLADFHRAWLHELAEVYELVWASAWGDDANRLLCPFFGIAECAVIAFPLVPFRSREKLPPIARFIADRPAAWVDDDITDEAARWSMTRSAPTLLIEIDPRTGLRREHVDRLLAWAGSIS